MSYFTTKSNNFIQKPQSELLLPLYNTLKTHKELLDGSPLYEDLIEIYMYQEYLLNETEEKQNEQLINAV